MDFSGNLVTGTISKDEKELMEIFLLFIFTLILIPLMKLSKQNFHFFMNHSSQIQHFSIFHRFSFPARAHALIFHQYSLNSLKTSFLILVMGILPLQVFLSAFSSFALWLSLFSLKQMNIFFCHILVVLLLAA